MAPSRLLGALLGPRRYLIGPLWRIGPNGRYFGPAFSKDTHSLRLISGVKHLSSHRWQNKIGANSLSRFREYSDTSRPNTANQASEASQALSNTKGPTDLPTPRRSGKLELPMDKILARDKDSQQELSPPGKTALMPILPRRPSKEELLKQASGFWGKMAIRLKWVMIRGYRPFNLDELSAFFSWIIWGHILWIVLGTTTFLSLLVWTLSKFRAEDFVAKLAGNIVTREMGIRVVFEEAIVPDWKQGVIVLRKVFMSRRPGKTSSHKVAIGSQSEAATGADPNSTLSSSPGSLKNLEDGHAEDDGNYTQFDLTIDHVAVTLSVSRWLEGKGILQTVEVKGVRGVVDRRYLQWDPDYDPTEHRKVHKRGDFDWEQCRIEDVLVTVLQGGTDRPPFQVGLYTCDLPRLRRQWLLYDFMNANNISGSFDNSLFTLHPRQQQYGRGGITGDEGKDGRIQRLRIDDVNIKHLNYGVSGMFGWIESGTVDFLADIILPPIQPEPSLRHKALDVLERWQAQLRLSNSGSDVETSVERQFREREAAKVIAIDLRVQFNNSRASAPLYTRDLNALNNALIHPIVAYINSRDTYIPIHCHVVKRLGDFDGSWTIYDSGLMQSVSKELYVAFGQNVADDEARSRRIKKVGFWSLQFLAQLVLLTLGIVA